jgi:cold shock CspA family protein
MSDPKPKRFEGFVAVFYPDKFYGFITEDLPGTHSSGIHFGTRDIRPDWRGSTTHAWTPGTPVSFLKISRPSKKGVGTWTSASDVCPIFTEEPRESLQTYRETSRVREWNGRFGELLREDGDTIFFHKDDVRDQFEARLANIKVGDYVFHAVGQRDDDRWKATNIELFSEMEQTRLQQGLSAQEPEPEPEPTSVLLSPGNCKRTLLELIQQRKTS